MSVDYWLQAFHEGEEGFFPLEVVEKAFSNAIVSNDHRGNFRLEYPCDPGFHDFLELSVGPLCGPNNDMIGGFWFVHAPSHKAFWQSLIDILKVTPSALYWADDQDALVISQAETQNHLPPDMIETLGQPRLVSSLSELFVHRPLTT